MSWTDVKSGLLYLVYAFVVGIILAEVLIRIFVPPMSTGFGGGTGIEWKKEYWRPINSDGYRDKEVELRPEKKLLMTIGDSFTAGHGVPFDQTYSTLLQKRLEDSHVVVNLGDSGASTKREKQNFSRFIDKYDYPDVVIYQYFGNDIQDLAEVDECAKHSNPSGAVGRVLKKIRRTLGRISYLYGILDGAYVQRNSSACYVAALFDAYRNEDIFATHKAEVADLVGAMRLKGASVIMIAFPYLNNDDLLRISEGLYIASLRDQFLKFCKSGDWFYDPSSAALNLKVNERVVNFMDAHPSPLLHAVVADEVGSLISTMKGKVPVKGATICQ